MGPKITGLLQRREERGSKLWSSGTYLNSLNSQIFKNHPKKLSKFFAAQIIKSILFDLKKSRFNADLKLDVGGTYILFTLCILNLNIFLPSCLFLS